MSDLKIRSAAQQPQTTQALDERPSATTAQTADTLGQAAVRGAKALVRMNELDRATITSAIPGVVTDIADKIVGGPLDNHLVRRNKAQLTALIRQGMNPIATETMAAGERAAELRSALTADGGRPQVEKLTAAALASIAARSGTTPKDFDALVGKLEILAALNGEKKLAMVSNRELKAKINQLTNGNLAELASATGRQLATMVYEPVRRLATSQELT
ncbi:hypothetical protein L6R52_14555 [Myxococcota bacterium]|nr:hypothetical protein [Myxococcota bacterium]